MKILMISNHLGVQSGVQRYVQNLLLHLDTAKYRVTLFVGQCPPDQASTAPALEAHGVEILAVPDNKKDRIRALAAHRATMVLFLSTSLTEKLQEDLLAGGYEAQTPAAVVYKATWPEEKIFRCTVGTLHDTVTANGLTKTSLIVVGGCLGGDYLRSLLYDPSFTTEFREATK